MDKTMKPKVVIVTEGGCVTDVQTNLPGLEVLLHDVDQQRVGEAYLSEFTTTPTAPESKTGPITDEERNRFDAEMEGNFEDSKTTVGVLLHIISGVPAAAAAFREWLADAEAFTKESESKEPLIVASRFELSVPGDDL